MNIIIHPTLEVNISARASRFRFVCFLKLNFFVIIFKLGFEVSSTVAQATCRLRNAALPPSEMLFILEVSVI